MRDLRGAALDEELLYLRSRPRRFAHVPPFDRHRVSLMVPDRVTIGSWQDGRTALHPGDGDHRSDGARPAVNGAGLRRALQGLRRLHVVHGHTRTPFPNVVRSPKEIRVNGRKTLRAWPTNQPVVGGQWSTTINTVEREQPGDFDACYTGGVHLDTLDPVRGVLPRAAAGVGGQGGAS